MAQFNFYCTAKNYPEVINAVCENAEWQLMPCWHPTRQIPCYHSYSEDLARAISTNKSLYLAGPFSIEGVCVEQIALGYYSVSFEKWGPLISLRLGGSRLENGLENIWSGCVHYNQWYKTKDGRYIKPSDELKAAYGDIVKRIKRISRKIRVQKWVYATEEVSRLLDEGKGKIQVSGKWYGLEQVSSVRQKMAE